MFKVSLYHSLSVHGIIGGGLSCISDIGDHLLSSVASLPGRLPTPQVFTESQLSLVVVFSSYFSVSDFMGFVLKLIFPFLLLTLSSLCSPFSTFLKRKLITDPRSSFSHTCVQC